MPSVCKQYVCVLLVAVEMLEQFETAVTLKLVLAQDEFRPWSRFTSA